MGRAPAEEEGRVGPHSPGSPRNPLLALHRLLVIFKISFSESGEENLFLWPFPPFFSCERLGEGCGGRREPGRAGGTSGSAPAWGPGPPLTAAPTPGGPGDTRQDPSLDSQVSAAAFAQRAHCRHQLYAGAWQGGGSGCPPSWGAGPVGREGQQRSVPGLGGWGRGRNCLEEGPAEGREGSRGENCTRGQSPVSLGGWQDMD